MLRIAFALLLLASHAYAAVEATGSCTPVQQSSDISMSCTVPADAQMAVVVIGGYSTTTGDDQALVDDISWDNGGTIDFTFITRGTFDFSFQNEPAAEAYYMLSTDPNWPGAGVHTLEVEARNDYGEGFNVIVQFYRRVNLADPIVDSEAHDASGVAMWTSALTGVGAGDMGVIFGADAAATPDVDPTGLGQTAVWESSAFNGQGLGYGEELGEDALRMDSSVMGMLGGAFAIREAIIPGVLRAILEEDEP